MKQVVISLCFLFSFISVDAKKRVVENPGYEASSSGINEIVRVEWDDTETRLHVKTNFVPNWWVKFTKEFYIFDPVSNVKLHPQDIIGGEFDKEIFMPASGDSTFIVVFPPLSKKTNKIDYVDDEGKVIWGISLEKPKKVKNKTEEIPLHIRQWLDEEIGKSSYLSSQLLSKHFFTPDGKIKVVGYIKGYDPRFNLGVGLIYASNELTNEDIPTIVELEPDGRFTAEFPSTHPVNSCIFFNRTTIDFYGEPGMVTAIIVDWEDFLRADRFRNRRYKFEMTRFEGPLARINEELRTVSLPEFDWNSFQKKVADQSCEDFKAETIQGWEHAKQLLSRITGEKELLPETIEILKRQIDVEHASRIFDFAMYKSFAQQDAQEKDEPEGYYDFLSRLSLNDPLLMVPQNFSTFINRLEYMAPFRDTKSNDIIKPEKSFYDFLEKDKNITFTAVEQVGIEKSKKLYESFENATSEEDRKKYSEEMSEAGKDFMEKYKEEYEEYRELYIQPLLNSFSYKNILDEWKRKDAVLKEQFGADKTLLGDLIKVRALSFTFGNSQKDHATSMLNYLMSNIREPILKDEAHRLYTKQFQAEKGYRLPEGKEGDIFRRIIEPYQGKYLLVDFWGIFCGPCIHNIKQQKDLRARLKNDPDLEFLFITSLEESPEDRYKTFVEEQDLEHTFILPADDYKYMRALFRFNGIPRYILVDRDGTIVNDNYSAHGFIRYVKQMTGRDDLED